MRNLTVLMPMAGLGSRFANAGYPLPKPLIEVDSQPMFLKALSSINHIKAAKSYHFVIRQEHVDTQRLDSLIKRALPEAHITILPEMTRGAAETALAGARYIDSEDGLIVMDCDLWFKSKTYNDMVEQSLQGISDVAGGVLTFKADNPRYSYARLDDLSNVIETAEKRVISNHAITGAYFFSTAGIFTKIAEVLLTKPINDSMPEYYMSLLYNILLDEGKTVKAAYVDQFASFGTPEELDEYNQRAEH